MCPFCLATVGLVVAGAASAGGLAALAAQVTRKINPAGDFFLNSNERRNENGIEHDGKSENSIA